MAINLNRPLPFNSPGRRATVLLLRASRSLSSALSKEDSTWWSTLKLARTRRLRVGRSTPKAAGGGREDSISRVSPTKAPTSSPKVTSKGTRWTSMTNSHNRSKMRIQNRVQQTMTVSRFGRKRPLRPRKNNKATCGISGPSTRLRFVAIGNLMGSASSAKV